MEKKRLIQHLHVQQDGLKIFMFLVLCLFSMSVMAQSAEKMASAADDNYKAYMAMNAASPLVKMYQHNPEIGKAYQAMRYAVILDNPKNFGDYTQEDLQNMRKQLEVLMVSIENIDAMVQKGITYEKSADLYARQMATKEAMDAQTRGDQPKADRNAASDAPSLMAPKQ